MALTQDELGALIEQELNQSEGANDQELRQHQETALDYYHCREPAAREADESNVISSDVRDMVTATMAQLTPMISNDALIMFEPKGSQDEDAARMEAHTCNKMVMDRNNGFVKLQGCIKDASLCRNAFAKVWAEEMTSVEARRINVPDGVSVSEIVAEFNGRPNVEAEQIEEKDAPEGTAKIELKVTSTKFRWRPVDPTKFYYAAGYDEHDLQNIRFCAERSLTSRSDLVAMGYDKATVDELPASTMEAEHTATRARDVQKTMQQDQPQSKDQELVDLYECYLMVDQDGDGIAERWRLMVVDKKKVLEAEQVDVVPFAAGSIMIRAHRLQGEDLFDHLKQTQDIKTGGKRRWLDNTRGASFSRIGAQKGAVDPKWEDARSGQFIYTDGPPQQALYPIPVVDVGPSIQALMDYEDKHRTEAGGAALDMVTSGDNVAGNTWRGILEQYTVKEMLCAMFARNLAETLVRQIYLLMHRTLRTYAGGEMQVRFRDQWTTVDPSLWPARDEINVLPGLTPRARQAYAMALQFGLQYGMAAAQQGLSGILVDADSLYRTVVDYYAAAGIDSPEQYWVDPKSEKARGNAEQQQAAAEQQFQKQIMLLERQLEALKLEHVVAARNKAIDSQVDIYKADLQAQTDLATTIIKEGAESERSAVEAFERAGGAVAGAGDAGTAESGNGQG